MNVKALAEMIKRTGYFFVILGGFVLIAVGILGLFLPVLPGWALIILGLILLGEKTWLSRFIISKMPPTVRERLKLSKKEDEE